MSQIKGTWKSQLGGINNSHKDTVSGRFYLHFIMFLLWSLIFLVRTLVGMRMWGNLFHFMSRASGGNPFSRTTFLIDFLIALTVYCWGWQVNCEHRKSNLRIKQRKMNHFYFKKYSWQISQKIQRVLTLMCCLKVAQIKYQLSDLGIVNWVFCYSHPVVDMWVAVDAVLV